MPRFGSEPGVPSQRQLRVGEIVRHALAQILTEGRVSDPALDGVLITVPEVRMSPDLKVATALVMPLGGRDADKVMAGLERSRKWFRGQLARRIDLKFTPEVRFRLDTRFDDDDRVSTMLRTPDIATDLDGDGED